MRPSPAAAGICLFFALASCGGNEPGPAPAPAGTAPAPWFRNVAATSGITFRHDSGHDAAFFTPEVVTGGVALLDAHQDGSVTALWRVRLLDFDPLTGDLTDDAPEFAYRLD